MNSINSRLKKYESLDVGLERESPVRLSAYSDGWPKVFALEAQCLTKFLQIEDLSLFHVGSTSIPGLVAKPIIDICGTLPALEELDSKQSIMETLGYEYKGEFGISGRRYAVLCSENRAIGYVHLHCYQIGHAEIERHLLFRDYLRSNSKALAIYSQEKRRLTDGQEIDRAVYTLEKSGCIQSLLRDAEISRSKSGRARS